MRGEAINMLVKPQNTGPAPQLPFTVDLGKRRVPAAMTRRWAPRGRSFMFDVCARACLHVPAAPARMV